jgi:hypothetical protein
MDKSNQVNADALVRILGNSEAHARGLGAVDAHGGIGLGNKGHGGFPSVVSPPNCRGCGALKFNLRVSVVDKETGEESQVFEKIGDVGDVQLVQMLCAQLFNTTQTSVVKDTGGTLRTISAGNATTAVYIVAGTGGTTAAVTDYQLGTQATGSTGNQTATVNAVSTSAGTVTLTANMQGPASNTTYHEVGIYIANSSYTIQVARDYNSTGWAVTTTQYLAVTYTITPS